MKALERKIKSYVKACEKRGETSIKIHEIQREFGIGYTETREILDKLPNVIFNACCGRYSIEK
jgi:hypothetical protein